MHFRLPIVVTLISGLTMAACGGSDTAGGTGGTSNGNNSTAAQAFIGAWSPTRTVNLTCNNQSVPTTLDQTLEWKAGDGADLVASMASCTLKANVVNQVATALSGQTCNISELGLTLNLTFTSYTFTLGADGKTASDLSSGSGTVSGLPCQYTESGTYTKQGN